ncbi:MAG: O-antigen ligase [Phormidesmis sp.]
MLKTHTDRQLYKALTIFEILFCIYGLLFYTELLFAVIGSFLPGVMGAVRYSIFGISFVLLLLRPKTLFRILPRISLFWLFYGFCGLSILWSIFPELTTKGFLQVIVQITLFSLYFVSRFSPKDQLRIIGVAMAITVMVNMFYVAAIPAIGIHIGDKFDGAWKGFYQNKNQFSGMMLWALAVFSLLSFKDTNKFVVTLGRLGLLICPMLVILSTSKTALVLFIFLSSSLILWNTYRWRGGKTILMLDLGMLTSFWVIGGIVVSWGNLTSALGKDPTISGRTEIWAAAITMIRQRPLLGYGFSAFWTEDNPSALWIGASLHEGFYPSHAHNGFIDILLDIGWIGMALFLVVFLSTWLAALKYAYRPGSPEDFWPLAVMLLVTSYNLTETSLLRVGIDWLFFIMAALSMQIWSQTNAYSREQYRERSTAAKPIALHSTAK